MRIKDKFPGSKMSWFSLVSHQHLYTSYPVELLGLFSKSVHSQRKTHSTRICTRTENEHVLGNISKLLVYQNIRWLHHMYTTIHSRCCSFSATVPVILIHLIQIQATSIKIQRPSQQVCWGVVLNLTPFLLHALSSTPCTTWSQIFLVTVTWASETFSCDYSWRDSPDTKNYKILLYCFTACKNLSWHQCAEESCSHPPLWLVSFAEGCTPRLYPPEPSPN